jgi:hemolysin III
MEETMSKAEFIQSSTASREEFEELLNRITHGLGLMLSVAGSVSLLDFAWRSGDAWRLVGCAVYALTLVGVYCFSTLSHSFSSPSAKRLFRVLDQGFIYLLIVGTYTPFALAHLRNTWWWLFLGFVWACALIGFISKVGFAHRVEAVSVWLYVALGWMLVIPARTLLELVSASCVWWMLAGGVCYTAGTLFLLNDQRRPYYHAVWHTFVIAGSACQFFPILFHVALPT